MALPNSAPYLVILSTWTFLMISWILVSSCSLFSFTLGLIYYRIIDNPIYAPYLTMSLGSFRRGWIILMIVGLGLAALPMANASMAPYLTWGLYEFNSRFSILGNWVRLFYITKPMLMMAALFTSSTWSWDA